ncbi:glutamate-5-semialdehyde dehydrogenase [Oceanispirochaeta crateris]|uniref:Gamma-glutamyl phosphate reductase n=1 Tax=Oceanispirochaeta crateris TaxID=2518645 RepID=A0A5C1QP80_9SPIO|nr:glutamate-5-semialdehyde dehydrogenase [Oceanispirochaeta crateris]QEN07992.1 glutamate-5-semialdehyde dehydrogenase [Oceanispirochaeta crateris]
MTILNRAQEARKASLILAAVSSDLKNKALEAMAAALEDSKAEIIQANREDYRRSEKADLPGPLLKRLIFEDEKISQVIEGIRSLVSMKDPVGETQMARELSPGLDLYRISCPIGVVGIIFESRPDALVQISSLCLKSGNALLLKGGSEAAETNRVLSRIIHDSTVKAGLPSGWIQLVETRSDVNDMFRLNEYIDLLIPRGSNSFVKYIMENSSIPVLGHSDGICHIYIHDDADLQIINPIVLDSKTQYVAACNSVETLLVHKKIASSVLPGLQKVLEEKSVELVGCDRCREIIDVAPASEEDWSTEYVDYKLSIKIVDSLDDAVQHINSFGSGHTDAILTASKECSSAFMARVDASSVFWNCSTRFSDGFRYGFGAEIGVSTSKIHARGPVGMEGLMIYKYKLLGSGQTVASFSTGENEYTHKPLEENLQSDK